MITAAEFFGTVDEELHKVRGRRSSILQHDRRFVAAVVARGAVECLRWLGMGVCVQEPAPKPPSLVSLEAVCRGDSVRELFAGWTG